MQLLTFPSRCIQLRPLPIQASVAELLFQFIQKNKANISDTAPSPVGSFLCDIAEESESGNLVTFIVNVIFEVSSTQTVRASTYSRPCYVTNFLTCFNNKLVQNKSFPLVKPAGGQGGQGDHGLLESLSKNLQQWVGGT